jgi:molybdenum cofactor guanylyltransferase
LIAGAGAGTIAVIMLEATAVVLAGGASRRMGLDKALLKVGGRAMIELVIGQLRPWFAEILISSDNRDGLSYLGLPVVPDLEPGCGPIMGITCGLRRSPHDRNLVVACDIPRLDPAFLCSIVERLDGVDALVPVDAGGVLQPTLAAYHRSMLPHLERVIASGRRSILTALNSARVGTCPVGDEPWLVNLNTPDDYATFISSFP